MAARRTGSAARRQSADFLDCGINPLLRLVRALASRLRHYRQDVLLPDVDTAARCRRGAHRLPRWPDLLKPAE
jgi:hypothetical protein